jgi:hypothetical protein
VFSARYPPMAAHATVDTVTGTVFSVLSVPSVVSRTVSECSAVEYSGVK